MQMVDLYVKRKFYGITLKLGEQRFLLRAPWHIWCERVSAFCFELKVKTWLLKTAFFPFSKKLKG